MIDLRSRADTELARQVMDDYYFTSQLPDTKYVLALVNEEFHYTDIQLSHLMCDLMLRGND